MTGDSLVIGGYKLVVTKREVRYAHGAQDSEQYDYIWKTPKTWASTCRQFTLCLTDSIDHVALFKFK